MQCDGFICAHVVQRPAAKELLKMAVFLKPRKYGILTSLIDKYRRWREQNPDDEQSDPSEDILGTVRDM